MEKGGLRLSFVTKNELIEIGFKEHQAVTIIQQAKKNLVKEGYSFYNNRRLGTVPMSSVEKIIGVPLVISNKGEENEQN